MTHRTDSFTALVTGASSGIGVELATELARRGYDLILVARREDELRSVALRLAAKYDVEAHPIALDLSTADAADRVVARLENLEHPIDFLVNNAGFAQYGAFLETDADAEMRMLNLNVITLTALMKRFVPGMVARGSGSVLNVASTAAFMPGPLMAVYYATKAYVLSLSEALAEELRGSGVSVTALCPGPTRTGFQSRAAMEESKLVKGRRLMASATVARAGIEGALRGDRVVIPGVSNKAHALLPRLLPRALVPRVVRAAQASPPPA